MKPFISNKTCLLVALNCSSHDFVTLRTTSFDHGRSPEFYLDAKALSEFTDGCPWNPLEYLERDGRSFLTIHRNGSMLRFTIYWLRNAGHDDLTGYMDTFLIDEEVFHKALEQEHSQLLAYRDPQIRKSRIVLSESAHELVRGLRKHPMQCRALTKALRDSWFWGDSTITLYADWNDDFSFREKRNGQSGIHGGLCQSHWARRGRDGRNYLYYRYSVHT